MREKHHEVKTRCGRMDHGGCGLLVEIEGNRITKVKGDPKASLSYGYTCQKGRRGFEQLYHPDRLTRPLKRTGPRGGGQWQEISWSQALKEAARGFNQIREDHGARAVAFCQGAPKGLEHFVLIRLANVFGSPNVVAPQNICHMPREISGVLTCGYFPVPDYDHSTKAVMVWGSNLTETNEEGIIHVKLLKRLRADRCPLIVVDPVRTTLAQRADYHLQLRPGSDGALALAFLNVIIEEGLYDGDFVDTWTYGFERLSEKAKDFPPEAVEGITGIPASSLREAARAYGRARPGIIQWGNGIEHTIHTFDVCRALLAMMALSGNLDVPGGNIRSSMPPVISLREFARTDRLPEKAKEMLSASAGLAPGFMVVPPEFMKRAILTSKPYRIHGAYVHVSNPVISFAESMRTVEALKRLDFLVVSEMFITPTAMLADLVLPVATQFEFDDIGHYGLAHGFILARRKIVEPPGSCWPDIKILNELGKALGHSDCFWEDYEEMLDEILEPSGMSYGEFARLGILRGPEEFRKYEKKGFKTPSGKVELALSKAEEIGLPAVPDFQGLPYEEDPDYPLILTSLKTSYFFCSANRRIPSLRKRMPRPQVEIHPQTASVHGIVEGDPVAIQTKEGRIVQYAKVTDRVSPQVVCASHGWTYPEKGEAEGFGWRDSNLNMLTSTSRLGEAFATPNLRAIPCRVEKA